MPQANAAEETGKLILDLPRLWANANVEERRKLILTMLDAVYVDAKKTKSAIAVKPKSLFKPVFQVAASREGSDIRIVNELIEGSSLFLVKTGSSTAPYSVAIQTLVIHGIRSQSPIL